MHAAFISNIVINFGRAERRCLIAYVEGESNCVKTMGRRRFQQSLGNVKRGLIDDTSWKHIHMPRILILKIVLLEILIDLNSHNLFFCP